MSGFHIEGRGKGSQGLAIAEKPLDNSHSKKVDPPAIEEPGDSILRTLKEAEKGSSAKTDLQKNILHKEKKFGEKPRNRDHQAFSALVTIQSENKPTAGSAASVHPDAMSGFLLGLAAAGCLIAIIFAVGGSASLWLILGLMVVLIVLGIIASRLSKQALADMRYARDRYSGKGLAAAGLVLGILSIVALIGLIAIILLGVTFFLLV